MSELLVRDRTTGAGWQICSKLNRIKHCYETRTKLRDPNKTALAGRKHEAEAGRAGGQGKTNSEQSRRAIARSQPGGEKFVRWDELSLRPTPLFDSSELSNVDDCVGAS